MYFAIASGVAPIMAPFHTLHASLPFSRSFWDCNSRTRAIITFDGFCTSPVRGLAITRRWLPGLNARTLMEASSLIRFSSRNLSTSSRRGLSDARIVAVDDCMLFAVLKDPIAWPRCWLPPRPLEAPPLLELPADADCLLGFLAACGLSSPDALPAG